MKNLAQIYEVDPNEKVMIETEAKFVFSEGKSKGYLILTDQKIVFVNNMGSVGKKIGLTDIRSIRLYRIWGLINKGLILTNDRNDKSKILIGYPKDWIKLIENQIRLIKTDGIVKTK